MKINLLFQAFFESTTINLFIDSLIKYMNAHYFNLVDYDAKSTSKPPYILFLIRRGVEISEFAELIFFIL